MRPFALIILDGWDLLLPAHIMLLVKHILQHLIDSIAARRGRLFEASGEAVWFTDWSDGKLRSRPSQYRQWASSVSRHGAHLASRFATEIFAEPCFGGGQCR